LLDARRYACRPHRTPQTHTHTYPLRRRRRRNETISQPGATTPSRRAVTQADGPRRRRREHQNYSELILLARNCATDNANLTPLTSPLSSFLCSVIGAATQFHPVLHNCAVAPASLVLRQIHPPNVRPGGILPRRSRPAPGTPARLPLRAPRQAPIFSELHVPLRRRHPDRVDPSPLRCALPSTSSSGSLEYGRRRPSTWSQELCLRLPPTAAARAPCRCHCYWPLLPYSPVLQG
jgi:hypothetical protein